MSDSSSDFGPDAPPDWEALARFRAGESSAAEARRVEAWMRAHPADARLVNAMDAALSAHLSPDVEAEVGELDVDAALASVKRRRAAEDAAPPAKVLPFRPRRGAEPRPHEIRITPPPVPVVPSRPRRARHAWAGAALAVAAAALVVVTLVRPDETTGLRTVAAGASVTTTVGQRDSVRLPDGSSVVLAPGSRLMVAGGYGEGARVVTIDGAALFRVTHDEKNPFTVRARRATVRDLGTVFTVRTDGVGAFGVAVSVTEGVVSLRGPGAPGEPESAREITLRAGDRGMLTDSGSVVAASGAASADDAAWAGGRLAYRAVPLAQVRADLHRWYGIELQVEDSALATRRLTATFDQADPATRVLDAIALALGASVDRFGNTAVLRPGASSGGSR